LKDEDGLYLIYLITALNTSPTNYLTICWFACYKHTKLRCVIIFTVAHEGHSASYSVFTRPYHSTIATQVYANHLPMKLYNFWIWRSTISNKYIHRFSVS